MLLRVLVTSLLALVISTLTIVIPTPIGASAVTHETSMRPDAVTGNVSRTRVVSLERPADTVVAYWRGNPHADDQARVLHRTERPSGPRSLPDATRSAALARTAPRTAPSTRSQGAVAVRVTTDRPVARLTVLGLSDGSTQTTTRRSSAGLLPAAGAATTEPTVLSRGAWGADPAYMSWAPEFYATKKLVVHHTDTSDDYTDRAGAEAQIRSIYYYHSVTQGWGDIGYNFLIDKFGNIYEGRYSRDYAGANPTGDDASGRGVTGAHTGGWNSGTVGIALLGTMTTHDATPAARQALERLLAWEASRNGIDPQATEQFVNPVSGATITTPNIAAHRDYAATACPGDTFYPTLPAIRAGTAALINGTPAPDTKPPSAPTGTEGNGRAHPGQPVVDPRHRQRRRLPLPGVAKQERDVRLQPGGNHDRGSVHERLAGPPDDVLVQGAGRRRRRQHRAVRHAHLEANPLSLGTPSRDSDNWSCPVPPLSGGFSPFRCRRDVSAAPSLEELTFQRRRRHGHQSTSSGKQHDVFVLSGGAARGAVQVGMMEALLEHGIVPDALVGTSVGALNAVFMGCTPDLRPGARAAPQVDAR